MQSLNNFKLNQVQTGTWWRVTYSANGSLPEIFLKLYAQLLLPGSSAFRAVLCVEWQETLIDLGNKWPLIGFEFKEVLPKTLPMYNSLNVRMPFLSHKWNAGSKKEGGKRWLWVIGIRVEGEYDLKWHLNWYQIFKELQTIWLSV